MRPVAPAVARNREPVFEVLQIELAARRKVLEIGSGTGEHAVFFAARMPWLEWQTSDRRANHDGINAWIDDARLGNVCRPLVLDVAEPPDLLREYDGVFSANTAHIMSEEEVASMFALTGRVLVDQGVFCLYGPFNQAGEFTSDSNARFDRSLRAENPQMGIRNLEDLDALGQDAGMTRTALYAMPANNFIAVWQRGST